MAFGSILRTASLPALPALAAFLIGAPLLCAAPARAQEPPAPTQNAAPPLYFYTRSQTVTAQTAYVQEAPAEKSDKRKREKTVRLEKVLADMERGETEARQAGVTGSGGDGVTLLAESSVAPLPVPPPTETTTAATLEGQLDALVKKLPHGTRWVKLMLPPLPKGKTLHGDDVADFALAQARMYGSVGEAVLPPGSVEVLSQPLGKEKASAVVPALNLRPVYLLLNPEMHTAMGRGGQNGTLPLFFATADEGNTITVFTPAPAPAQPDN